MITKIKILDKDGNETYSIYRKNGLKYYNTVETGLSIYEYYGPIIKPSRLDKFFGNIRDARETRLIYNSVYQDVTIVLEHDDEPNQSDPKGHCQVTENNVINAVREVFLVINRNSRIIHGCFGKRELAERYIGKESQFQLVHYEVFNGLNN